VAAVVRFWMDGSGWAYAARATAVVLFAIVTLGIALAVAAGALKRYKCCGTPGTGDLQAGLKGGAGRSQENWWCGR